MTGLALVNGEPAGALPLGDRGFAYGDGLFETLRVRDGRPLLWPLHWQRLSRGCQRLGIPLDEKLEDHIIPSLQRLSDALGWSERDYVAKLVVTRGAGGRGYRPGQGPSTWVLTLHALPPDLGRLQREGMVVRQLEYRLGPNPVLAGLKHLNRLDQVLASLELGEEDEGLVRDQADRIIEGTKCNLLLFMGDEILTPVLDTCGIAGVLRQFLLNEGARLGFRVHEAAIDSGRLKNAEGMAMINSVMGICPVRRLNDVDLMIPASLRRLQTAVHAELGF